MNTEKKHLNTIPRNPVKIYIHIPLIKTTFAGYISWISLIEFLVETNEMLIRQY